MRLIKKGITSKKSRTLAALAVGICLSTSSYLSFAADQTIDSSTTGNSFVEVKATETKDYNIMRFMGNGGFIQVWSNGLLTADVIKTEFPNKLDDLKYYYVPGNIFINADKKDGTARILVRGDIQDSTIAENTSPTPKPGWGDAPIDIKIGGNIGSTGAVVPLADRGGTSILEVQGNLDLNNSLSTINLDSTNGSVILDVTKNIGSYSNKEAEHLNWFDVLDDLESAPIDTFVGVGDVAGKNDVTVTAKNIYTKGLSTTTTQAYILAAATTATNYLYNGNVTYEADEDFYANGVTLDIANIFNGADHPKRNNPAKGGNISYIAGRDLVLGIDSSSNNLSNRTPDATPIIDADTGYYGSILYDAGRDLYIFYRNSYNFLGNTSNPDGNLTYKAGDHMNIRGWSLNYKGGAGKVEFLAEHDIDIQVNNFTYAGARDEGAKGLDIISKKGSIQFTNLFGSNNVNLNSGTGDIRIIANEDMSHDNLEKVTDTGNITVLGNLNATVERTGMGGNLPVTSPITTQGTGTETGSITITAQNVHNSATLQIGDSNSTTPVSGSMRLINHAENTPTSTSKLGHISVTANNIEVNGDLTLTANALGNVNVTAKDGSAPIIPRDYFYQYGIAERLGSYTDVKGNLYISANDNNKGQARLETKNLFVSGNLILNGERASLSEVDVLKFGNGMIGRSFNGTAISDFSYKPSLLILTGGRVTTATRGYNTTDRANLDQDPNGIAAGNGIAVLANPPMVGMFGTQNVVVGTEMVGSTADPLRYIQGFGNTLVKSDIIFVENNLSLYSHAGNASFGNMFNVTPTITRNYDDRQTDGSLYIGNQAFTITSGFQTPLLVLGRGVTLNIGDRLSMGDGGRIEMYDNSQIVFNYRAIEDLDTHGYGSGGGNFAKRNKLIARNISYTFTDAPNLINWANSNNTGELNTLGQHRTIIRMTDPNSLYNYDSAKTAPADSLKTIGFVPEEFVTNLDFSPFFKITRDYLDYDNETSTGDMYEYAIKSVEWQPGIHSDSPLRDKAPTPELGSMALVLDRAGEYNVIFNNESVANHLYMSRNQDEYNRSLTNISAGSNLNALYMVNHKAHTMALDHAAENNRADKLEKGNGVWGSLYRDNTSFGEDYSKGANGLGVRKWGFIGGYDRQASETTAFGAYLDVGRPKLSNDDYGNINGDDFQLGIYGSWRLPSKYEIGASLGGGWQSYDAWRTININRKGLEPVIEKLDSEYKGSNFDFALEFARPIQNEKNWFRPALGYHYQSTSLDGFTENSSHPGLGSLAQSVDSASIKQHFLKLGLSGGWKGNSTDIKAKLFWVNRLSGDDRPSTSAHFAGLHSEAGSQGFTVHGAEMDKNYFNIGVGLTRYLTSAKNASVSLDYETSLGSKRTQNLVNLALNVKF